MRDEDQPLIGSVLFSMYIYVLSVSVFILSQRDIFVQEKWIRLNLSRYIDDCVWLWPERPEVAGQPSRGVYKMPQRPALMFA